MEKLNKQTVRKLNLWGKLAVDKSAIYIALLLAIYIAKVLYIYIALVF